MTQRLFIYELSVVGPSKSPATLKFKEGLNVISGASDTGKSFIYQCLAYMLGGKSTPKTFTELDGYTSVKLKIGDPSNAQFEFTRSLQGGDFSIQNLVTQESTTKNRNELFDLLAETMGVGGRKLKKNKQNETVKMSFAALRRFIMCDETNIISESSPILSERYQQNTSEKSAFKFILSGIDDADLIKSADNTHDKLRKTGKRIAFDDVLQNLKIQVGDSDPAEILIQRNNLEKANHELLELLSTKSSEVSKLVTEKTDLKRKELAIDERLFSLNNNLERFTLLLKTYQSDINRIEFVSEGKWLFEQLIPGKCPYCGSTMDHTHDDGISERLDLKEIEAASQIEIKKINSLMSDLHKAISDLKEEHLKINEAKNKLGDRLSEIELQISESIKQDIEKIKIKIRENLELKEQVAETYLLHTQIAEIEKRKTDSLSLSYVDGDEEEEKFNQDLLLNELCKNIESTLEDWKVAVKPRVSFNLEQYDIVVDGKARGSRGKGFRAILLTAFLVSLRKLSLQRNSFHPGLIVIDSPLTTHEEVDKVDSGIQEAIFVSLSKIPQTQVILIDNKTPPPNIEDQINHFHFSGIKGSKNQGFVPGF